MPNFSISSHTLSLTTNFDTLEVYDTNPTPSLVDSFDLATHHRVSCTDLNYVIECIEEPSGLFMQLFGSDEDDSFEFSDADGIGISDLRTERSQFTYHLDLCYIVLQCVDSVLQVQSPCTGLCSAPSEDCCDIVEV